MAASLLAATALAPCAATANALTTLYSFTGKADGKGPAGRPILYQGALYGTTEEGGSGVKSPKGTIYKFDISTGIKTTLHVFGGTGDGVSPSGSIVIHDGKLYGATYLGGAANFGTLFTLNLATGVEKTLYSFKDTGDGDGPDDGVVYAGGKLFASVDDDKMPGQAIAKFDLASTTLSIFHAPGTDGGYPPSLSLIGDLIYATDYGRGTAGSIYTLDPATGTFNTVYSFNGPPDGKAPIGSLIEHNDTLYGATYNGGAHDAGSVFDINLSSGQENVIHSFSKMGPSFPGRGVSYFHGGLYGAGTVEIGKKFYQTIFRVNPKTGYATHYAVFDTASTGESGIYMSLIGGVFYGVAYSGGSGNSGTIFKFAP